MEMPLDMMETDAAAAVFEEEIVIGSNNIASSHSYGDLKASFSYKINHLVNISSSQLKINNKNKQYNNRLLISKETFPTSLFSYAVPSQNQAVFLQAWGRYSNEMTSPLLPCNEARLFLESTYSGSTATSLILPGALIKLPMGEDLGIDIKLINILPKNKEKEDDKSSWFITDKKKFRIKTEEMLITVKSTHKNHHLLIFSENIPESTHDDIKMELLSPVKASISSCPKALKSYSADEDDVIYHIMNDVSF